MPYTLTGDLKFLYTMKFDDNAVQEFDKDVELFKQVKSSLCLQTASGIHKQLLGVERPEFLKFIERLKAGEFTNPGGKDFQELQKMEQEYQDFLKKMSDAFVATASKVGIKCEKEIPE